MPPVRPMLAKSVKGIPDPAKLGGLIFEPKWDGFRCIVFRDGDEVELTSRNTKPLTRYFPELVEAIKRQLPQRCVLDGEVFVAVGDRLEFEVLQERIHPAKSRVDMLAEKTPAGFVAFDLLALGDESYVDRPLSERRAALEGALGHLGSDGPCYLTRTTADPAEAERWFEHFEGAGLDGVVAKRTDGPYLPGKREMVKVKHRRDADCVVMGYRIHKSGNGIGSLLLGLYRPDGELTMVGGAASFTDADRLALLAELEPLRIGEVRDGEPSRWNTGPNKADKQWVPIRPERVAEVAYDQMEGDRFRHTVKLLRWRPDRDPASCTFDQLDVPLNYDLTDVLET